MKPTLLAALLVAAAPAMASEPAPIQSTIVLQSSTSWDGHPYKGYPAGKPQLTVRKVVLQPGAQFPWHTHPIPAAGYVMSGRLEVESRDGKYKTQLGPGEVLAEMQDVVHRGRSGDTVTELVVFYAGAEGVPISEDSPE